MEVLSSVIHEVDLSTRISIECENSLQAKIGCRGVSSCVNQKFRVASKLVTRARKQSVSASKYACCNEVSS